MVKKIMIALLVIIIAAVAFVLWSLDKDTKDKYEAVAYDESMIPQYDALIAPFTNKYDATHSLPILGSAILDLNSDGVKELFVGGGKNQKDVIMEYKNGQFIDITDQLGFTKDISQTTYGAVYIDMTQDGLADLLIARDNAIYLYENNNGNLSEAQNLNLKFNDTSQPLAITVADLNRDGWADLFVSNYIPKDKMEGQTIFNIENYGGKSQLFLNNGNNDFTDITDQAGLNYIHNTFSAVFVDLDNDGNEDLVVAHDTGEPRIYKNDGDLTFSMIKHPLTGKFSYPMGIAIGDYDNNGYQDIFFSNVGSSLPKVMVRGDLTSDQTLVTDWILFSNQGDFNFIDKAVEAKIANYEFSWGAIFEDFNLDGLQDLVVSENYVDLPNSKIRPLPSRFLMQLEDHSFTNIEGKNNTKNPCNGISPLLADFNNDGYPDLVHVNLDGDVKVFISRANVKNNYIKVQLPETVKYLNATVTIETKEGKTLSLQNISGEGLASDQSHTLFFGLAKETSIKSCHLRLIDGSQKNIAIQNINSTWKID